MRKNALDTILMDTILDMLLDFSEPSIKKSPNFLYNVSYVVIDDPFNLGFFLSEKSFLSGKTVLYV